MAPNGHVHWVDCVELRNETTVAIKMTGPEGEAWLWMPLGEARKLALMVAYLSAGMAGMSAEAPAGALVRVKTSSAGVPW